MIPAKFLRTGGLCDDDSLLLEDLVKRTIEDRVIL